MNSPQVALVQMPISDIACPSLALSLLKAGLGRIGIKSMVHYLNFLFADMVDKDTYNFLANGGPRTCDLAGEWIFTEALWGHDTVRDAEYMHNVLRGHSPHHLHNRLDMGLPERVQSCRENVEPFLNRCLQEVDWGNYCIVGFSSVFQQQIAALSLAKRIKERHPDIHIIFGGANCEGVMGATLLENFPFIDSVCQGEGDSAFPQFAKTIMEKRCPDNLPGILYRESGALRKPNDIELQTNLDLLPYPDYDDYFEAIARSNWSSPVSLMIETSRGCWWGEKSHCTFCGLNGTSMRFRFKSAKRALDEILWLLDRYGKFTHKFCASDNIIPYQYFREFLGLLRDLKLDINIFYETKANLRREHIVLYHEAGLREIQPGIESLSTPILQLMKKGVSALQNIQLLKWCQELSIEPSWNYLVGFPGERTQFYEGQDVLIRSITHLPPPHGVAPVRIDRFSPYHHSPDKHNISNLEVYPAYRYIYPLLDQTSLDNIAYFFVGDYPEKANTKCYIGNIVSAVDDWQNRYNESSLTSVDFADHLLIVDHRTEVCEFTKLRGLDRVIFMACDTLSSRSALQNLVTTYLGEPRKNILDETLSPLLENKLILQEGDFYLNLVVPMTTSKITENGGLRELTVISSQ